jgi:hypothetical protein
MKIIISESQYNNILEMTKLDIVTNNVYKKNIQINEFLMFPTPVIGVPDSHTIMTVLAIGTAFIPIVGPFISAGIGIADAAMYYNEGDKKTAGVVGALSILPFIGPVVSKIPGIKQLGKKGMSLLASKISKGGTNLSSTEKEILKVIEKEKNLINAELKSASEILKPMGKNIDGLRKKYILKYGEGKYDLLLGSLLSKKITPKAFTQRLQSATASAGSGVAKNLVKVYRGGPKKSSMFFVSPSKKYVTADYVGGKRGAIYSMNLNLGKVLDLTKIDPKAVNVPEFLKYLQRLGVKLSKEESAQILKRWTSRQSTKFKKVYTRPPLWLLISSEHGISNAAKRSGFNSIKQFETTAGDDWTKGGISYFILNLIQ